MQFGSALFNSNYRSIKGSKGRYYTKGAGISI